MATTVTGKDVADNLLRDLGAPTTTSNERVVAMWLAFENSTIVGNNPWNIEGNGTCGSRQYNGSTFAVYCSLSDGISATAQLLQSRSYYRPIVTALQNNDAIGFISALVASPWSRTHYGGGSKLFAAFKSTYNYATKVFTVTSGSTLPSGGGTDPAGTLSGFGGAVSFPIGHVLTSADIQTILAALQKQGQIGYPGSAGYQAVKSVLDPFVGQAWTKALQDQMQAAFGVAANNAANNPLQQIADAVGKVFNPTTWIALVAFLAGAGMIVWGANRVLGATGGPAFKNPLHG